MQNLTQPSLLLKPFAESGDKNTLPVTNTDTSNPQKADLTNGFPQITSESPDNGGLPPERADFNGLGYLTTTYDFFAQAGGTYTFNSAVATAIGGYPKGARLWYTNGSGSAMILRSAIDDNTYDFTQDPSYIGNQWIVESFVDLSKTGMVQMYAGDTAPAGWLMCDGSAVSRTTYPALFAVIGTKYGEGDGSTTFNLPNMRDRVPQGSGARTATNGQIAAGLPNITGQMNSPYGLLSSASGAFTTSGSHGDWDGGGSVKRYQTINFNASRSSSIYGNSTTVQPDATCFNFIIKY